MTILKCKMCGGNIQASGETHGICDSCGCEVTLPKIDDDKRAYFYNRGNDFRQAGNFDDAYSAYEHIIAEDNQDAEAHWNLMLCRYGIEYVRDARLGEYVPTCSRLNAKSVLDDRDYLDAMKYADEYTKDIYRREARKIADIQKRFLEISRNEAPYDVFICFKAESETGERTQGSVVAQEIYSLLEKEGVRAFFSRITLENKLGEDFEPYIYAALNSAKVMLVVSDKPSYLQARWVKNEWKRYLAIMDKDRTKNMIPVCVDMSPYDLPDEMSRVQAVEWNKIGAAQDLIRGVLKITGKLKSQPTVIVQREGVNVENSFRSIEKAINSRDFETAKRLVNRLLDELPENGKAHYYAFLIFNEVQHLGQLSYETNWEYDARFKRVRQYGDDELVKQLDEFLATKRNEKIYAKAKETLQSGGYDKAHDLFNSIATYKDSAQMARMAIITKNKKIKYESALQQFETEVGNKDTYIERRLKAEHKQQMNKLAGLEKRARGIYATDDYSIGTLIGAMIMFVAAIAMGIFNAESTIWQIAWPVGVIIFFKIFADLDLSFITWIILVSILIFVEFLLLGIFDEGSFAEKLFVIISSLPLFFHIKAYITEHRALNAKAEKSMYYQSTIEPLVRNIINELTQKYGEAFEGKTYNHMLSIEKPFKSIYK